MKPPFSTPFRIGRLRVEPALDEVSLDGVVTKLEPRAMRLLVCLAAHAGEILSVEQLLDAVWKDVVVGHDSVYQAVAGLRRVLRDDPKNPTYIANVVRRGYRLVAAVTPWVEEAVPAVPDAARSGRAGIAEAAAGEAVIREVAGGQGATGETAGGAAVTGRAAPGEAVTGQAATGEAGVQRGPVGKAGPSEEPSVDAAWPVEKAPAPGLEHMPADPLSAVHARGFLSAKGGRLARGPILRRVGLVLLLGLVVLAGGFGVHEFSRGRLSQAVDGTAQNSVVVQDRSVAVLPFIDLSEKRDQTYFADGLTEEIIDRLARVPGLRVPARTSLFYYKGRSAQVREVGRELGVGHVLEGSVRITGQQLRITAQFVRADNGYQIWSKTYNLSVTDSFEIQDEIATSVVLSLKATLLPAKTREGEAKFDPEAVRAVSQARFLLDRGGESDTREAVALLERAVEMEPHYARAWGELAAAHRFRASFFDDAPEADIGRARAEALRALALDPQCVEAHDALADVKLFYDFDPEGATRELEAIRAVEPTRRVRNPFYSGCVMGACYEQVIRDSEEEIARDPLNPSPYSTRALAHYVFGDLEEAERDIRRAIGLGPDVGYRRYMLVRILLARGDFGHLMEALGGVSESLYDRAGRALAFYALGRRAEADRLLEDLVKHEAVEGPYQIAEVYAARGDFKQAMSWLERAYTAHDGGLWTLQVDPLLRPLMGDARFVALKAKLRM